MDTHSGDLQKPSHGTPREEVGHGTPGKEIQKGKQEMAGIHQERDGDDGIPWSMAYAPSQQTGISNSNFRFLFGMDVKRHIQN